MDLRDIVVAALEPDPMRFLEHVRMGDAGRWLEAVGGKLDQETQRIIEIYRIHEATILDAAMLDAALVEALDRLKESDARHRKGDVMHGTHVGRGPGRIRLSSFVGEHGD